MDNTNVIDPKDRAFIVETIARLINSEIAKEKITEENNFVRNVLIEAMENAGIDTFECVVDETTDDVDTAKVTLVKGNSIQYDVNKIKENLPKGMFKRIVDTRVGVNDFDALKVVFKAYNVPTKEVKHLFDFTDTLREDVLKKLYEIGDITVEQLAGTYTVKEKKPYLRLTLPKAK